MTTAESDNQPVEEKAKGAKTPRPLPKLMVGGQAVLEGVMMRSDHSFAVACRRADGRIVLRESVWRSIWEKWPRLRWPFLRGSVVLVESLINGFSALSFSAIQQEKDLRRQEKEKEKEKEKERSEEAGKGASPESVKGSELDGQGKQDKTEEESGLSSAAIGLTMVVALVMAVALFVGVPHLLTWLLGFKSTELGFHLVDGVIKAALVVGYMAAISMMSEIRRVFMYHGAEHKSIYAYEKKLDLTVENAKMQSRFHPRCGTSFLFMVIIVSIILFAALLRTPMVEPSWLDHVVKIFIKIPLMLPVAGIAYEAIRLSGKHRDNPVVKVLVAPGLWLQHITTREPTDDQVEVALAALRKTLWRENTGWEGQSPKPEVEFLTSLSEVDVPQSQAAGSGSEPA